MIRDSVEGIVEVLNQTLQQDWLESNSLSVNTQRTKFMLINNTCNVLVTTNIRVII